MLTYKKEIFRKTLLHTLIASCFSIPALAVAAADDTSPTVGTEGSGEFWKEPNQNIDGDYKATLAPNSGEQFARPKGLIVRANNQVEIKGKTNINVTLASEANSGLAVDSNAAYGIAVGYDYAGGNASDTASLTLHNDANITVKNTENTVKSTKNFGGATAPFGHQLSGVKVYRKNGAKPVFNSEKKLTITVEDKTTAKIGDYLVGLYVSGDGAEANLKDSDITVKANGKFSAALKIGKPELPNTEKPADYKGAVVNSTGKMVLDTTESKNSATVRLFGTKSRLIADSDTSSGEIKSGNSAVVFDTQDYTTKVSAFFISDNVSRNESNKDQEVRLNNTKITTTSDDASLIVADAKTENSFAVTFAGNKVASWFNNGEFVAENAKFTLKGKDSEAKAAENGWLAETKVAVTKGADLTFTLSDQAKAIGLMQQQSKGNVHSKLDVHVNNQAVWELKQKGDEQRSTINALTLDKGVLDASKNIPNGSTKTDYKVKLVKQDGTEGTLTSNNGEITLANGSYEDKLTVEGNYTANNGVLKVNTHWDSNDANNGKSDLLEITGNAEGTTKVVSLKADGTENMIDGTIGSIAADLAKNSTAVVRVQGESNLKNFTGIAKTTGAGELQLASKKVGNTTEYFWTVVSTNKDAIYTASVPAYTLIPNLNLEVGYETVGTLHQRRGENQALSWEKSQANNQIWGRIIGKHIALDGKKRLNLSANLAGFQFGHDFDISSSENGGKRLTGGYVGYTHANSKFYDEYRAENGVVIDDKYTGKAKTENLHVGVTHTRYSEDGSYIDFVGQLSWMQNKYNSLDSKAKNHGLGVALSGEVGRPFVLSKEKTNNGDSWIIEPQAQLIYQYLGLNSFTDDMRSVHQDKQHNLRSRIGVRFAYNNLTDHEKVRTLYFTTNVWHNFRNTSASNIGEDNVTEKLAKTWGEVGLGAQFATSSNTHIYADARYEQSLSGTKHQGYKGSIGIKYSW
ncbi:autotransporter outer membrane beta-barrel domain-containing protein [Neisseria subflava]|uniref:autotransporter family protein n=1 Tax=Neisseria subflava TaxID=28449 RepID=UPI0010BF17EB|nr:autotransporter outer membrane beta-barrel domain-containing protein [Neisseria subflava]QCL71735.1 autotransporter outer membrane beta-barrel domain-containing protein [Neisseria subflava]WMS18665.1 autotransporter outer membrane beta-barrel domain-containing protein [Neisseria subflava]